MQLNKKQLQSASGAILSAYILNHYLEETKHLGLFKQTVKKNVTRTINDLTIIEQFYFDEVYNIDDKDLGGTLIDNNLVFLQEFLKFDFNDFSKIQEIFVAYQKDPNRLSRISDKILIENGAKKI